MQGNDHHNNHNPNPWGIVCGTSYGREPTYLKTNKIYNIIQSLLFFAALLNK